MWVKFELIYLDIAVQYVSHYSTENLSPFEKYFPMNN